MKLLKIFLIVVVVIFLVLFFVRKDKNEKPKTFEKDMEKLSSSELLKEAKDLLKEAIIQDVTSKLLEIDMAIKKYELDNRIYPDKLEDLVGKYLKEIPSIDISCESDEECKKDAEWSGNKLNSYKIIQNEMPDENEIDETTTYIYSKKGKIYINNKKYFSKTNIYTKK